MKQGARTDQTITPELGENLVNFVLRRSVRPQYIAEKGCQTSFELCNRLLIPFDALLHEIDIGQCRCFFPTTHFAHLGKAITLTQGKNAYNAMTIPLQII